MTYSSLTYTADSDVAARDVLVSAYESRGFVIVENLLTRDELQSLRDRTSAIVAGRIAFPVENIELEPNGIQKNGARAVRKLNRCAESDAVYLDHARNAKILAIVEALIGKDIKLFGSQAFLKPPGGIEKPYHQDSAYFPIEPMAMVTCWAALDDVTLNNGCMWVIPGSHRQGVLPHSELWMVGERQDMRVPEKALERRNEVPLVMLAGSCSFHHSLLLHSSCPNHSSLPRRGLAVHYMSAQSKWTDAGQVKPDYLLLQGREYAACV